MMELDPQTPNRRENYGLCCACHKPGRSVRNIMTLGIRAPQPGTGWGCLQCGLPNDGAFAVICDRCLNERRDPVDLVDGYLSGKGRKLIADCDQTPFGHDLTRHPEFVPTPAWATNPGAFKGEMGCGVPCGLAIYPHVPMVPEEATPLLETFLLWLPEIHPDYAHYILCVSHLRNEDKLPPDMRTKVVLPRATHDITVARVDPRLDADPGKLMTMMAVGPATIDVQIAIDNDQTAIAIARDMAIAIVDGRIHPETYNTREAENANSSVIGGIILKRFGPGTVAIRHLREGR